MSNPKYFISYSHTSDGDGFGFGNCDIVLEGKVHEYKTIKELNKYIEQQYGLSNVVILNWRRFEDYD